MKLLTAITIGLLSVSSLLANRNYTNFLAKDNLTVTEKKKGSDFEKAVEIIKKYETLHKPGHWPFVGYGHKVQPGEKFSRSKALTEKEADALLRKDLLANCAAFRSFGADSLLMGVLAYNIGPGAASRSSVAKKLKAGNRDIYENYIAHSKYRGKTHKKIQSRRIEEFETLFVKNPVDIADKRASSQLSPEKLTAFIYGDYEPRAQFREAPADYGLTAMNSIQRSPAINRQFNTHKKTTIKKEKRSGVSSKMKLACISKSANQSHMA